MTGTHHPLLRTLRRPEPARCPARRLIDPPFSAHLESQSVDLIQFAFRWVNCLLVRAA